MRKNKMPVSTLSKRRKTWLGAAALAALIAGGALESGVVSPSLPAQAEMLSLDKPVQAAPSFADVVDRVKPAVVSVRVKVENAADRNDSGSSGIPGFGDDDSLREFFRRFQGPERGWGRRDGSGDERRFGRGDGSDDERRFGRRDDRDGSRPNPRRYSQSQGSGFFISADGYLVTNNHVVDKAASVEVVMDDGRTLDAKVIGTDPKTDVALLKVDGGSDFPHVRFTGKKSRVGDWVLAVGNPFGLGGTVTAGIVSAEGRNIGAGPYDDFLQIDAPVNRGNSGGPTFNLAGEVVGVNTAIASPSGGSVGIAFAIPAHVAEKVVADLKTSGKVTRGFIGVQIQPVTKEIADAVGLKDARGALVAEATGNSPAAKAGIKTGDAIVAVDGEPIKDPHALALKISSYAPGKSVPLTVWRDGKERTVSVEIGGQEGERSARADVGASRRDDAQPRLGLQLAPAPRGEDGVAVAEVDPRSPAAEKGIREGDLILDVAGQTVSRPDDVRSAVEAVRKDGRKTVLLRVKGRDGVRFVAVPFAAS
jgi:serine protease Do